MNHSKLGGMCLALCLGSSGAYAATIVDVSTGTQDETIVNVTPLANLTHTTIFPQGNVSFADEVVSYNAGSGFAGNPHCTNANNILGVPDYTASGDCVEIGENDVRNPDTDTGSGFVSLGHHGSITIRFTDNSLTASGDPFHDLFIFEIGLAFEPVSVDISKNGVDWIAVAAELGQPIGIDIDAVQGVVFGEMYSFVRITDAGAGDSFSSRFAGADIDAVGAISSGPALVPIQSSMALMGTALTGLWIARRSRIRRVSDPHH